MRDLTISKRFLKYQYDLIMKKLEVTELPDNLFNVLEKYAGLSIEENVYYESNNDSKWIISQFGDFKLIYGHVEELKEENLEKKIVPFAIEEGGWLFVLSLENEEYGAVYVYKTHDFSGKEALHKITNSFESFINSLTRDK